MKKYIKFIQHRNWISLKVDGLYIFIEYGIYFHTFKMEYKRKILKKLIQLPPTTLSEEIKKDETNDN